MDAPARPRRRPARALLVTAATAIGLASGVLGASSAGAHTESDVVAVPASAQATVKLEPTHGCNGSPTVEVSIRAPIAGATAGSVPGWTGTATDNAVTSTGARSTTLTWTGGSLPADHTGAFPVIFTVPDTPGELVVFPSIQRCANGEVLRWISGDPVAEFPAPRVLVLPRGSQPAATLDDVPAGVPGRDLLIQIIDVDDPDATTTTTPPTTTAPSTTTTTEGPTGGASNGSEDEDEDDALASAIPWIVLVVLVVGGVGSGIRSMRRKRRGL